MLASDHTHREWRSRVWNVVGEAVEEELLPYKELFTTVVLEQVLVAAATERINVLMIKTKYTLQAYRGLDTGVPCADGSVQEPWQDLH